MEHKGSLLKGGIIAVILVACISVFIFWYAISQTQLPSSSGEIAERFLIVIKEGVFEVEQARTFAELRQGLSGRDPLRAQEGMWFDFGMESQWGIWMKDMKFSLDILWLNKDREIIFIVENVSPESYPKVFSPDQKALYVLELPAGTVEKFSLGVGDKAFIK